jgi:hypothetical protein
MTMALVAGTVAISSDGTVTGDGLAEALADAKLAAFADSLPTNANALAAVYAGIAADANATANAVITYLLANAEPVVDGITGTLT